MIQICLICVIFVIYFLVYDMPKICKKTFLKRITNQNTTYMVNDDLVEILTKAKGSLELKKSLKTNDIKAISVHFNESYVKTKGVIEGKHFGHPSIVECAQKLSAFYAKIKLNQTVDQIIKSYEPIN